MTPTIFLTLYFDAATERAITEVWHVLAEAGMPVPGVHGCQSSPDSAL
ncbi:hypothetical protein [Herpetosiphon gulosus]